MPVSTPPKNESETGLPFEEHLRTSVQGLRGAFAEVMAAIDIDATKPQQMARQVGLDKSLSWKLSRILGEEDGARHRCASARQGRLAYRDFDHSKRPAPPNVRSPIFAAPSPSSIAWSTHIAAIANRLK